MVVHSDQGYQYGSGGWLKFCSELQLEPSMSRRVNYSDNSVEESIYISLEKECIKKRIYKTRDLARPDIFDYIEVFCNRTRSHSHLGGARPGAFEKDSF